MRKLYAISLTLLAAVAVLASAQETAPLRVVQTIPLPNVHMRMDHLGVDVQGKRLFAAALGDNQNTVEVIDLQAGKRIASIPGQVKPQGIFYSGDFKKVFVANGGGGASIVTGDGAVKIFDGTSFKLLASLPMGIDADHVNYDAAAKYLYVGYGTNKSGALGIIDTRANKHIGDIKTQAGPGGIMVEKGGPRIFVRFRGTGDLGVVDRNKREQIATWPVKGTDGSYALAYDEANHRLFDTTRKPPMLLVYDTESGKEVARLDSVDGIDDVWYDAAHKRIYATGGRGPGGDAFVEGLVAVYQQKDRDHYELIAKVPSQFGACTSIWVPQLNRLYVSAPGVGGHQAAIVVMEPQP